MSTLTLNVVLLHLGGFVCIRTRIWWSSDLHATWKKKTHPKTSQSGQLELSLQGAGTRGSLGQRSRQVSIQPAARRSCPNLPGRNLATRAQPRHATCPSWTVRARDFQKPGRKKTFATWHSNGPVHELAPKPSVCLSA